MWATFWAGDGIDSVWALTIAPDDNPLIAGSTTSKNLLPNLGGYQSKAASLFVAKLSADGKSILAGTYFGGNGADLITALRLDRAGNVYIAGNADSDGLPDDPGRIPNPARYRGTASVVCAVL